MGWVSFGETDGENVEVGTVSHIDSVELSHEPGEQTLGLVTDSNERFVAPFYYGVLDGDHNFDTKDDQLLFLVLFDQTASIRFAMWNFFKSKRGKADTHSPAWDWQYVIADPEIGKDYGYRARIIVKPFLGVRQVVDEYHSWKRELRIELPVVPTKR